jgi:hypothetical protein
MVLLAPFIGPALGLLGGALGAGKQAAADKAAQKAAAAANLEAKKKAEAQFARAQQEYELSWQQNLTKYYWEQAQVEQIRKIDAQSAADQAQQGSRLIWGTIESYNLNTSSLYDKYVTQENLRAMNVSMDLKNEIGRLITGNQELVNEAKSKVTGYLTGVLKNGLEAQMRIKGAENEVDKLVTSLTTQEMRDNYIYNAKVIMAAMDGSVAGNQALSRTGGGDSSKALALNSAKRALMDFADVHLGRQARVATMAQMNSKMNGEVAQGLAQLATESAGFGLQAGYAIGKANIGLKANAREAAYDFSVFEKLTMPSFKIANDSYARELRGLQLGVMDNLYNATLPYRQKEVFDPLMPTKGIAPTYYAPTPVAAQTGGFFGMASAALGGANAFSPTLFSDVLPNALSNMFRSSSAGLSASGGWATAGVPSNYA